MKSSFAGRIVFAGALLTTTVAPAKDWYVDANYGNNEWDGSCKYADRDEDAKKGPKKWLSEAMLIPDLGENDVIHAARGVYNEGGSWDGDNTNRVDISKKIGLVADEGRDVTFIEGALSTDPGAETCGNGPGAVRCVKISTDKGAYLKGFTVCNGRTDKTKPNDWPDGGGCISVCGNSAVIDCIVTNGNSAYRGVIAGWGGGNHDRVPRLCAGNGECGEEYLYILRKDRFHQLHRFRTDIGGRHWRSHH